MTIARAATARSGIPCLFAGGNGRNLKAQRPGNKPDGDDRSRQRDRPEVPERESDYRIHGRIVGGGFHGTARIQHEILALAKIGYASNVPLMTTKNSARPSLIKETEGDNLKPDQLILRTLLLEGARSKATGFGNEGYFASLRAGINMRIENLPE